MGLLILLLYYLPRLEKLILPPPAASPVAGLSATILGQIRGGTPVGLRSLTSIDMSWSYLFSPGRTPLWTFSLS
jgi:hypothetical protein